MDHKDVEMEDFGKIKEDGVVGDQECAEKDQPAVTQVGNKQEESSGAVNADISVQSPNEIGVEQEQEDQQEELSKKDAYEMNANASEPVDVTHDSENDATKMGDDSINDCNNDATEMGDDDKIDDNKQDASEMDYDEKIDDSKKDATELGDDGKNDARNMDDDHGAIDEIENYNDEGDNTGYEKHQELATPHAVVKYSHIKAEDLIAETPKNDLDEVDEGYESGTADDQERFMKEVDAFYKAKGMEFKPPKFYGQPLNCLKLWRSVIKLGGYDRVTGNKWWRQVGEAFHPPKTCTTVSWTFRIFYEKALLEYERHKVQIGDIELPHATGVPETTTFENEANGYQLPGSGSGRARRDSAARAMQGWHSQRLFGYGSEEKNPNNLQKREKSLKSIGLFKHKRPSEVEHSVKAARTETTSRQVVTTVTDVGPPADWVKINVLETKDCFEVYALVPGLLREEVRVQSDPAGILVITGQPEQLDNPWGISPFKKVINLPARIDPLRTSAVVSLHGRLLVRVPFEQSNI
ncbi:AT-rich interactive domain-containing protein 6-like [Rutidosis leptorrhynchoides]|uniref:AT-rich interactive domain-containing protein 6-like n=1 Tax=Rutidosis leptorrhynchoides TaxID=125765 RepID=UPI003A98F3F9